MKVTNLMEEFVKTQVDDMYSRIKKENPSTPVCDCENCRMDTLCYVLNRVPPKYTISARGVNHAQREFETLKQISADVDKIVMDGIRLISSSKRPNHNSTYTSTADVDDKRKKKPHFYFPIMSGYVYDGTTFESLAGAQVSLYVNGKLAKMLDSTWQNPYKTFKATEASYNFCVSPELAPKEGITQDFSFELKIEAAGYEPLTYPFKALVSSKVLKDASEYSNCSLKIQDMFLFPLWVENTMERYPKALD